MIWKLCRLGTISLRTETTQLQVGADLENIPDVSGPMPISLPIIPLLLFNSQISTEAHNIVKQKAKLFYVPGLPISNPIRLMNLSDKQ